MAVKHKTGLSHAFTIVELLVVIVVVGILATITIVSYTGITQRAIAISLISDLDNASKQLKLFQVDNGNYPTTINCAISDSSTNKCIKASGGTSYQFKLSNINYQVFCLTATKSSYYKYVGPDTTPMAGSCPVLNLDAGNTKSYIGSGVAWNDLSGNDYNLTLNGGVVYSANNGGTMVFDGLDDYVESMYNAENMLGLDPSEWSYSVWFRTNGVVSSKKEIVTNYDDPISGDGIVGIWTGINGDGNTGRIFIDVRGSGAPDYLYTAVGTRYDDSLWHNITVTAKKNDYVKGYIDGVKFTIDASSSLGASDYIDNAPFRIGSLRYGGVISEYWLGNISSVSLYNRALSNDDVTQNFNTTKGRYGL